MNFSYELQIRLKKFPFGTLRLRKKRILNFRYFGMAICIKIF